MDDRKLNVMPGNSQRRNTRQTSKKGAAKGTGGKNKDTLKGRGKTLPADERPWHKGYSGTEKLPSKTAWKQDKETQGRRGRGARPEDRQARHARTPPGAGQRRQGRPDPAGHAGRAAPGAAAPGRARPQVADPEGRAGAARRAQPGGRGAARARPGDRALRGAGHRDRRADQRGRAHRGRPRHRDPGGQPRRARPAHRWRAAPGHRSSGAAVRVRALSTTCSPPRGAPGAAAGRARRGHRPAQPRCGDPVGRRVRRAGRLPARAACRRASPRPRGAPAPARRPGCRSRR